MVGVSGRRSFQCRSTASPLHHVEAVGTSPGNPDRYPAGRVDALRQHDPNRGPTVFPWRRTHRAPHSRIHSLERCGNGRAGKQARGRHRRPPLVVCIVSVALRGRFQPLLAGQGRRAVGRPHLHAGPCRPRHLRPRIPRGPVERREPRQLPYGDRRQRPVIVSPSASHARVLGVPDRFDGSGTDQLHLPRSLRPLLDPAPHR